MDTIGSRIPWPVILLALVFFFPLGLVLLVLRVRSDRGAALVMGSILAFIGWGGAIFFGLFGSIGFAMAGESEQPAVAAGLGVIVFGFAMLGLIGSRLKARGSRVRRFVQLIVNQGQTSIAAMAQILGRRDVQSVAQDLQRVIDGGYLPGVGIDYQTYTVHRAAMPRPAVMFQPPPLPGSAQRPVAPSQVTFTCRACGANNAVAAAPGVAPRCEYCDTPTRA